MATGSHQNLSALTSLANRTWGWDRTWKTPRDAWRKLCPEVDLVTDLTAAVRQRLLCGLGSLHHSGSKAPQHTSACPCSASYRCLWSRGHQRRSNTRNHIQKVAFSAMNIQSPSYKTAEFHMQTDSYASNRPFVRAITRAIT